MKYLMICSIFFTLPLYSQTIAPAETQAQSNGNIVFFKLYGVGNERMVSDYSKERIYHYTVGKLKARYSLVSITTSQTPSVVSRSAANVLIGVKRINNKEATQVTSNELVFKIKCEYDPANTNAVNISGFLNMLIAARDDGVSGFVYAASSSTYGDHQALPKVEDQIGNPLSPYAVTKYVNELYADVFSRTYGFKAIGLRYFNVFGPRQDPNGAYAAVIPKWVAAMLNGEPVRINGDGETSRDFCFVENAIQANLLAAMAEPEAAGEVYNVAVGQRTTLNELLKAIRSELEGRGVSIQSDPVYCEFRAGDVRHSLADVSKAHDLLGYEPTHVVAQGIELAMSWYLDFFRQENVSHLAKSSIASESIPYSPRSVSK